MSAILASIGGAIGGAIHWGLSWIDDLLFHWSWPKCAQLGTLIDAHINLGIMDWMSRLVGPSFKRLEAPSRYIAQISCPLEFPSAGEAQYAWLQGAIDSATYQCWVEMNDQCFAPFDLVTQARARKLLIPEATQLYHADELTADEYSSAVRANGVLDPALESQVEYTLRGKMPVQDLIRSWHRDTITVDQRDEQIHRHGFVDQVYVDAMVDLATPYLSLESQVKLWQRDLIGESTLEERLLALGFQRTGQLDEIKQLATAIPTPGDLTRMMMRDSADTDIVTKFDLDAEFEKKFKGRIPGWARAQGMEEEHLRYQWRAHWTIPPPGQLYTMLHRLRHIDPADPAWIDADTVRTALEQQDILPFWVPKLLEISTAPITRVDARRAYAIGIVDRQALVKSFWDRGYSDPDAETLADYVERDLILKWRKSPLVTRFAKLELTETELDTELSFTGLSDQAKTDIKQHGKDLARDMSRTLCTKAVKSRFKTGELDYNQSRAQLIQLGHDAGMASDTVAGWECEIKSKGKPQSAARLCSWLGLGLITAMEMLNRLGKLGYSQADAMQLVVECQQKIIGRNTKEYERQLKAQQREFEKQARNAQRSADKLQRQQEQGARAAKASQQAQANRDNLLVKMAKLYADRHALDITDTFIALRGYMQATRANWVLTPDQGIKAVVLAVEQSPPVAPSAIAARIDEIGESFALAEQ
jgi:hypothetical protein